MLFRSVSVTVDATGASVYGVDEFVPNGWTVSNVNEGGAFVNGKVSWLFLDNINRVLSYTATAPAVSGIYVFDGNYTDGVSLFVVGGETDVNVSGNGASPTIKINEIEANQASGDEWVELYNPNGVSVDISGWKLYDGLANENLIFTIPGSTVISANGYYVADTGTGELNNAGEFVTLKDLSDTEIDQTTERSDSNGDGDTWQRIPDGADDWEFVASTRDATNVDTVDPPEPTGNETDDLMVNYVRGKILIDGQGAAAGQAYRVEVLNGPNAGIIFDGTVDRTGDIPVHLLGRGYFDTRDNIGFSTGADFKVTVDEFICNQEGTFENGGNGWFEPESGLTILNCVGPNDVPEFVNLNDVNATEGDTIEFTVNATDLDVGDTLTYSATGSLASFFNAVTRVFSWVTGFIDAGEYEVEFIVSDGKNETRENITITVANVNRDPVLGAISDQTIDEDIPGILTVNATDIDIDDDLDFDIIAENVSEVDCSVSGETVTLTPAANWFGTAACTVEVDDGAGGTDSQAFSIVVQSVNDIPVLDNIDDVSMQEGGLVSITVSATEVDGDTLTFGVNDTRFTKIGSDVFQWQTDFDDAQVFNVEFDVSDGVGGTDSQSVMIEITVNVAPVIESFVPDYVPKIPEDGTFDFSVIWSDYSGDNVTVEWFKNGVSDGTGDSYTFQGDGTGGVITHNVTVVISDGEFSVTREASIITSDIPLTDKYNGDTTNFTNFTDADLTCADLILEIVGDGRVDMIDCVDMRDIVDLDRFTDIQRGFIGVDSIEFGSFQNKRANLTMFNLPQDKTPSIAYNTGFTTNFGLITEDCPSNVCLNVDYNTGTLKYDIPGFSSFLAGATKSCSQQGGNSCSSGFACTGSWLTASDSNMCCSAVCLEIPPEFNDINRCANISSLIGITIKEPDKNEDFDVGEDMEVEIKVKNDDVEDHDFDVDVFLYNVDDDNTEEDDDDSLDVDEGESEEIEFTLPIPNDLDEDERYYFFTKVEDDDICNEAWLPIGIDRLDDDVAITDFDLSDLDVICGDVVEATVDLENIGSDDQDVVVSIESSSLGLNVKSDEIELEKFDDDDDDSTVRLLFTIPDGETKPGEHNINAVASYSGEETISRKTITVGTCLDEFVFKDQIDLTRRPSDSRIELRSDSGARFEVQREISRPGIFKGGFVEVFMENSLIWILLVGILILITLIFIVHLGRRRY